MTPIPSSELLINPDGSIFHLHLLPEDLADDIILVGDPGRVETIASHFDQIKTTGNFIPSRETIKDIGSALSLPASVLIILTS